MKPEQKVKIQIAVIAIMLLILAIVLVKRNFVPKDDLNGGIFDGGHYEKFGITIKNMESVIKRDLKYTGGSSRIPVIKPVEILELEESGLFAPKQDDFLEKKRPMGEDLELQGVLWGGNENLAIISGSVYAVGEVANGALVIEINKDKVVVSVDGTKIELNTER